MFPWKLVVGALLVVSTFAQKDATSGLQEEKAHDAKATKETNYKKYIGEFNYRLPFKTQVKSAFTEGQTIHIVGALNEKPVRADFNFQKGERNDSDLPLHFSIRFDEGIIHSKFVYNTFMDGNWSEKEQRINNPFKKGQEFDLRVRIEGGKYRLFANRKDVGKFDMRQELDGINYVSASGDLSSLKLFHYGGAIYPMPYTANMPLLPGKRLDISGIPTGKRFNVNLYRPNKEYALQVSVRFGEKAVVRNAMANNVWGKEEREGGVPVKKGEVFDMTIINEEFAYQIFMNGKRFATFAHRGSPTEVKTLEIDGDVEVHTVTLNDAVGQ